jgi:ABC-type dipeptide/oligopeptide/nickel transport system permease subunit
VIKYVLIGTFVACYGGVFGTLIMTMINVLRASPFFPPPVHVALTACTQPACGGSRSSGCA